MAVSLVQGTTQQGVPSALTHAISLPALATAGNLLVSWPTYDKDAGTLTAPTGWSPVIQVLSANGVTLGFSWKVSDGTEQSITWTCTTARPVAIRVAEYSGISTPILDVSSTGTTSGSSATSVSTGTTAATTDATATAFAIMGVDTVSNVSAGRAWTNSFVEQEFSGTNSAFSHALKELTSTGTQESTFSTTGGGDQMVAIMAVFKSNAGGGPTASLLLLNRSIANYGGMRQ